MKDHLLKSFVEPVDKEPNDSKQILETVFIISRGTLTLSDHPYLVEGLHSRLSAIRLKAKHLDRNFDRVS